MRVPGKEYEAAEFPVHEDWDAHRRRSIAGRCAPADRVRIGEAQGTARLFERNGQSLSIETLQHVVVSPTLGRLAAERSIFATGEDGHRSDFEIAGNVAHQDLVDRLH